MTRIVRIDKAQQIGSKKIEDVTIHIEEPASTDGSLNRVGWMFTMEAERLEDALWRSLPGGIYDRLFAAIVKRQASILAIAYPDIYEKGEKQ